MIWHVLQKVVKCYFQPLPWLSYIYWLIYLSLQSYGNHVTEISGSFRDPARVDLAVQRKIVNFWRFQDGSMNLLGITSKESWFLISYKMLLKHGFIGWKFQRTLKLDISFSLEHFFISVAIFTQVASCLSRSSFGPSFPNSEITAPYQFLLKSIFEILFFSVPKTRKFQKFGKR